MKKNANANPVVLGEQYTDSITGFSGTATVRSEFLYGCVRVVLEGHGKDNEPQEFAFDEQRLTSAPSATSGGQRPTPSRTGLKAS